MHLIGLFYSTSGGRRGNTGRREWERACPSWGLTWWSRRGIPSRSTRYCSQSVREGQRGMILVAGHRSHLRRGRCRVAHRWPHCRSQNRCATPQSQRKLLQTAIPCPHRHRRHRSCNNCHIAGQKSVRLSRSRCQTALSPRASRTDTLLHTSPSSHCGKSCSFHWGSYLPSPRCLRARAPRTCNWNLHCELWDYPQYSSCRQGQVRKCPRWRCRTSNCPVYISDSSDKTSQKSSAMQWSTEWRRKR